MLFRSDSRMLYLYLAGISGAEYMNEKDATAIVRINPRDPNAVIEIIAKGGYSDGEVSKYGVGGIKVPSVCADSGFFKGGVRIVGDLVVDGNVTVKGKIENYNT